MDQEEIARKIKRAKELAERLSGKLDSFLASLGAPPVSSAGGGDAGGSSLVPSLGTATGPSLAAAQAAAAAISASLSARAGTGARTGWDVQPSALDTALAFADSLQTSAPPRLPAPRHPAPVHRTLDELLQRDRDRIAAADARNLAYQRGNAHPGACSVYVTGVPPDATGPELEEHFSVISPVARVKMYRHPTTNEPKGDALDAAVMGAVQLLHRKMLRPGIALCVSKAVERIGVYAGHGGGGGLGYGRGDGGLHELETRAAVRFQSLEAAAAALDALDGRHFDTRPLRAAFDDGTYAARLDGSEDTERQTRFGFGDAAAAYQDSLRVLRLAAAEGEPSRVCEPSPPGAEVGAEAGPRVGAPSIVCDRPLGTLPHYDYLRPEAAPDGGYYRRHDAPPPSPLDVSRAILQRASDAGAPFVTCAEFVGPVPHYDWRPDGPDVLREAAAAGAEFVLCPEHRASAAGAEFVACPERVMDLPGYEFRLVGSEGVGYYKVEAEAEDAPDYNDFMATMKELGAVS
ncbi:hypothetical protein EMIHUDRAFT_459634 [Emiliania huxleyi CCMP1516]|uniref:RRM domain-containing protein n=2 Tax=Emiliania huxleyi TaxID=2903 RepID=A0A0D3INC6_EMIH1|nr:hypothetical protein EMIHUDRAFT_459634 [Emiliania huxleyi CCMP1516]EOD12761.1 hypothetical protein EMIHUDRAFT_459634 [Emiliania huxleyi CCMP1516]|eukprot:XP_005765190.1 hypothetical protein EMIHUDRAFT_459634 [Emiliania huxleyi CCMP1516]